MTLDRLNSNPALLSFIQRGNLDPPFLALLFGKEKSTSYCASNHQSLSDPDLKNVTHMHDCLDIA